MIDSVCNRLIARYRCMKLMYETFGKGTIAADTVHNELDRRFLVTKDCNQSCRFDIRAAPGNQIFKESVSDKRFGRAAVYVVDTLKNPCLYAKRSYQSVSETPKCLSIRLLEPLFGRVPRFVEWPNVCEIDLTIGWR